MGNVRAMYATDADILDYMGKENADMIKKIFEARDQGGKKRGAAGAQAAAKKPKPPAKARSESIQLSSASLLVVCATL
jgi:hypothetical protein